MMQGIMIGPREPDGLLETVTADRPVADIAAINEFQKRANPGELLAVQRRPISLAAAARGQKNEHQRDH